MTLSQRRAWTVLTAVVLMVTGAVAQQAPDAQPEADAAAAEAPTIRFTFKDAPLDQVLDFFNRETGLPVIRKTEAKGAPITFISPHAYEFEEALRILNMILQTQGIHLYRDAEFLYLEKLDKMIAAPVPTYPGGDVPDDLPANEIVSVVIPLNNATSKAIEEQLKSLVSDYGALVALPQQNAVILTETAAQCRRIQSIIDTLDAKPVYEDAVRIFPLEHAQATDVMQSLKALVAEKQKTVVIDGQGNRRVIEEDNIAGVRMEVNEQTNSVIAIGPEGRLRTIEQLIGLLDVPGGNGSGREMATFALNTISATEAGEFVTRLFASMPQDRRPTLVPMPDVGKLTIVGSISAITQAGALLGELDGATTEEGPLGRAERRGVVMSLDEVSPRDAIDVLTRLLSPRQRQTLNMAAAPGDRSIIVVGPTGDIEAVRDLLDAIDRPTDRPRDVKILSLNQDLTTDVVRDALDLYETTGAADEAPISVTFDDEGTSAVLVGSRTALDRFSSLLNSTQQANDAEIETRTFELQSARASEIAGKLRNLARPLLTPNDGAEYVEPQIEAVDGLDMLIVRARSDYIGVLRELIQRLDDPDPKTSQFRVIDLRGGDPVAIGNRAMRLFEETTASLPTHEAGLVSWEIDEVSGKLLLMGDETGVNRFASLLNQVQQLTPPSRTTRLIDLQFAKASEVATGLGEFLEGAPTVDPARTVEAPSVRVIERTNALMVTAEEAQHQMIADYVRRLDVLEPADLPPLKLLQVRTADAVQVAQMLSSQYGKRASEERREKPVEIRADASTNTLIVSAHESLFEEIKAFVDDLNVDRSQEASRVTEIFPLRVAKAADVAQAMEKLYPMPPIPLDRRGRPMPWLQEPREVNVSADPASNTLIVDAPAERMDAFKALVEKLDRVELPPQAELRTYSIERADLAAIATTLRALANHGSLGGKSEVGKPNVPVTIETEPNSGTLIVGGDSTTHELVERILVDLGRVPIERNLRVVRIENADPAEVMDRALSLYDQQTSEIPSAQPVDVTVDEAGRSLMIVAEAEAMMRFMRILDELETQAGPPRELRLVELQHAQASDVVEFLNGLLDSSRSFDVGLGPQPVFEPISENNSLLIAAQPEQHAIIDSLVRSVDVPGEAQTGPLRILRLRTADAANIARILQQSYGQRPSEDRAERPVSVRADENTNTLIVSAHPEMLPEIEQLVAEFNDAQSYDSEGREIRIYPLKVARAEELAQTLDQMFPEPPVPQDRRGRPQYHLQQPREVVVRADRQTNSIIVDAPAKRLAGFEQLVAQLDRAEIEGDSELRTYRVEHARLDAVAETIRSLARSGGFTQGESTRQKEIVIETEPVTRTLIVSGPPVVFDGIESVLDRLDASPESPETQMLFFALERARAERVQPLLSRILTTRLESDPEVNVDRVDVDRLLEVAADKATNTLIMTVPTSLVDVARELVARLDSEGAAVGRDLIRIVPLTFADARETATTLAASLQSADLPSGGDGSSVTITAASSSNALVVSGAEADIEFVAELVRELDTRPTQDALTVRTFTLKHARADEIAPTVQRLLVDQRSADPRVIAARIRSTRGRFEPETPINVEAEARTNALIVSGPAEIVDLAEEIVRTLDAESDDDKVVQIYTPKKAAPDALIDAVGRIVNAAVPGRTPVQLTADRAAGAVIVIGEKEQVAEALKRLADLDGRAIAAPEMDLQMFALQHADADAIARSLESMLQNDAYWPDELRRRREAGLSVAMPTASADARANRVLVSAPTDLMPIARRFIEALDRTSPGGAVEVRVFPLRESKAESVAEALSRSLAAAASPGEPKPLVTAEAASNTVIVAASAERVEQAARLIEPMDASIQPDLPSVRTVYLEHARAESVAPVVQRLLAGRDVSEWMRIQMIRNRLDPDDGPDVRVEAEPRLNAVVISAPASLLSVAEETVRQLDVDRSQATRPVRILPLRNADAAEVAENLQAVLSDAAETGEADPVIRVDRSSNAIIVRATPSQVETVERLVGELDASALIGSRQIRMIQVDRSRVDAAAMAETVRRLLEQRSGVKVNIVPVEDLVAPKGKSEGDTREPEMPQSEDVEEMSRRILVPPRMKLIIGYVQTVTAAVQDSTEPPAVEAPRASPPPEQAPEAELTIAVDPATNALIVIGSGRTTERVAELVAAIERDLPPEPGRIHVLNLPDGADARALSGLLRATVREIGSAGPNNPGGLTGRVSVLPDPQGDAIIVAANDTDFDVIRQLTSSLARPGEAAAVTVKVYELTSVSARRAADAVRDLFSEAPSGRQARQFRTGREIEVTLADEEGALRTVAISAGAVQVTAGPSGTSVIVAAPSEAMPLVDEFIGLIDQTTYQSQRLIREYRLKNARASAVERILQRAFEGARNRIGGADAARALFVADDRTNTLIVTGSDDQHQEAQRLLEGLDTQVEDAPFELTVIPLETARPRQVADLLKRTLAGRDDARREQLTIEGDDTTGSLLVRASEEELQEIRRIIDELDQPAVGDLPVRSVKLERADAAQVADSLRRFFDDRSRALARPGQRAPARRVAIVGDRRASTVFISANDEDFAEIKTLIDTFDAPAEARDLQFRVIPLENALVGEIGETIEDLTNNFYWSSFNRDDVDANIFVQTNERTNSVVLMGSGQSFDVIESIIKRLDVAGAGGPGVTARAFPVENADLDLVRQVLEQAFPDPNAGRWWRPSSGRRLQFQVDAASRRLIVIGPESQMESVETLINELDGEVIAEGREIATIPLAFADAERVSRSLSTFFRDRARRDGADSDISIIGSRDGNVLIVSGTESDLALARDIVAKLDAPEIDNDRRIEIIALEHAEAGDVSRAISQIYPRTRGANSAPVVVSPDNRTNSLVISAPEDLFPQVESLVRRMDAPSDADVVQLRTFELASARADDVASTLRAALDLESTARGRAGDLQGRVRRFVDESGAEVEVRANITPDPRANSLIVSADEPSMNLIAQLIEDLDEKPTVSEIEYRVIALEHAVATEIELTVERLLRKWAEAANEPEPTVSSSVRDNTLIIAATTNQLKEVDRILSQIDVESETNRVTEFVPLKYADAEKTREALKVFYGRFAPEADTPGARNVSIVADPATNSLVVSADEAEWPGIREILEIFDSEEYDSSRQLAVIPLTHADAQSVAAAINAAFESPLRNEIERRRQEQQQASRRAADTRFGPLIYDAPSVLVSSDEIVSVSAEPLTNSLIVSAGRQELERVRGIVGQLDVPEFENTPMPRVIVVEHGRASVLAESLRQMYANTVNGPGSRSRSSRSILIHGDDASNVIIVRAGDSEFEQIRSLAATLQDEQENGRVTARVLKLNTQSATRMAGTIQRTFEPTAQRRGEALSVEVDRASNALVIASSRQLFEDIERLVNELDGQEIDDADDGDELQTNVPNVPPGQELLIIELEHTSPEQVRGFLDGLGVTRPAPNDRPSIVAEPVTLVPLENRRAVAMLVARSDRAAVESLVRTLDTPPLLAEQEVAIISLSVADAPAVASTVEQMLRPENDAATEVAESLREQLRRLRMLAQGVDGADVVLDLATPIRITPEAQTNSVIVTSTPDNVAAVGEIVRMLDRLPIGDAVVVRIFHLDQASATRISSVVQQLFRQGEALRRAPGSKVAGLPTTETGRALAGEIAVAVDDRTNALIVAGREEAVALAEVLIGELDSDETANWIEPRLIDLDHADAIELAETLNRIVVEGVGDTPEAASIQRQVGRLRVFRENGRHRDADAIESSLFSPMDRLVILPEQQLNALVVVGSRANVDVVEELVGMLDVKGAARTDLVRLYPLTHAAADRVSDIIRDLFAQQVRTKAIRPEDDVVIQADLRTNTLVIATSPRSFAVIEELLKTLDSDGLNATVGLHVLPIENNDAASLAPKIEQLMRARLQALQADGQARRDVVSIRADVATNALIVAASDENVEQIKQLVDLLGREEAKSDGDIEIFSLETAQAGELAQILEELYANDVNRTRGAGTISIRPDQRLNALLVNAPPGDIARIRELIERLDATSVSAVREIKVIPLQSANALEIVNLLERVLGEGSISGRRASSRQASLLRLVRKQSERVIAEQTGREPTETEIDFAIREQVSLTPDLRTNSVIVSAPPPMMVLIETLIETIDSSEEGERDIVVFTLTNADATNLAEILSNLFRLSQQGNIYLLVPNRVAAGPDGEVESEGVIGTGVNVVPDERQQLSITVDARTNSLLVSGTPQYLELVGKVIRELDSKKGAEREQVTVQLKNARVEEVAQALNTFITQEQERIARTLGPDRQGSMVRRLEQEISVVGVPGTSRLILSASPRYMEKVLQLIDELDRAPSQVLIQVMLAEVTLDSEKSWGVDLTVLPQGQDMYTGFTRAAGSGVLTAIGVPNLSVSSVDFDLLIRALEVQGRLEVLSRPQILVNDNEDARIQVGEEIQLVTNVERLDNGNTRSDVTPRELGVILEVTPTISPDGFVRLDIAPSISSLTTRTTQVSEDFEAPVISQRRANTTVTVQDGQTIVIGGMIENSIETRDTKVPLLGDIPLVGYIFKSKRATTQKTELLIVITPRVIPSDDSRLDLSMDEIETMDLSEEMKQHLRDRIRRRDAASKGRWAPLNAQPALEETGTSAPELESTLEVR